MSSVPPPNGAIAELCSSLGDDSARELVDIFLNNFPNVLRDLNSGDREQRRRAAHSLKSSSHIVGAEGLSSRMAALEARLTQPTGEVTPDDVESTVTEFERVAVKLREFAHQK
ncbi:MAG: Hpt domain-containing protein [Verrucomicrobia bacterium]|nr:Hpt domain-containing protein [Verrucomicrobiota bacterium]